MDVAHYVNSHGLLWIPIVFTVYTTGIVVLGGAARKSQTNVRRIACFLLLTWVVGIPACMKAESDQHQRSVEPDSLFEYYFEFPPPPSVRILGHEHHEAFDSFSAYLEFAADPETLDRILANERFEWSSGSTNFHSYFPTAGRSKGVVCNGATREVWTRSPGRRFHSRYAWLCIHDETGRAFFADTSLD